MFFRTPRFIRRFFRRRMHPMAEDNAWSWKSRFAFAYAFFAWNSLGYVAYQIARGNKHWPTTLGLTTKEEDEMRPALYFAHLMGVEKADVVRIRGFEVEKTTIEVPKEKKNPMDELQKMAGK